MAPLKQKNDKALPTRRADLLTRLIEWEGRDGLAVQGDYVDEADEVPGETEDQSDNEGGMFDSIPIESTEPNVQYQTEEV